MKRCIEIVVIIFNIVFLLAGFGVLGIGIWVRTDKAEFDPLFGESLLPIAAYIMIGAGALVAFIALIGCYGTLKENRKLLAIHFCCLVVIFLLQIVAAILGLLFFDKIRSYLDDNVGKAVVDKYSEPGYQMITTAVDTMHTEFECCGYNSPFDWTSNSTSFNGRNSVVPISCCINPTDANCNKVMDFTKIYHKGCVGAFMEWLRTNFKVIAAVALSMALVQLIGIGLAFYLCMKAQQRVRPID